MSSYVQVSWLAYWICAGCTKCGCPKVEGDLWRFECQTSDIRPQLGNVCQGVTCCGLSRYATPPRSTSPGAEENCSWDPNPLFAWFKEIGNIIPGCRSNSLLWHVWKTAFNIKKLKIEIIPTRSHLWGSPINKIKGYPRPKGFQIAYDQPFVYSWNTALYRPSRGDPSLGASFVELMV